MQNCEHNHEKQSTTTVKAIDNALSYALCHFSATSKNVVNNNTALAILLQFCSDTPQAKHTHICLKINTYQPHKVKSMNWKRRWNDGEGERDVSTEKLLDFQGKMCNETQHEYQDEKSCKPHTKTTKETCKKVIPKTLNLRRCPPLKLFLSVADVPVSTLGEYDRQTSKDERQDCNRRVNYGKGVEQVSSLLPQ